MSWFEEQLKTRNRLDDEQIIEAYDKIARAVVDTKAASRLSFDELAATDNAVAALLHYFGRRPDPVPDTIVDPLDRMDMAIQSSGLMKRKVYLKGEWWKDATGAYLGQLKSGEAIAIFPFGMRSYVYVEPRTNKKVLVTKRTAADVMSEAYCFYRPLPDTKLSLRDLVHFMFSSLDPGDYMRMIMAALVVVLIGLLPAVANNLLFDRVIPSGNPNLIVPICALLLGAVFGQALIGIARNMITARLSSKLSIQVEAAMTARLFSLDASFFKNRQAGDLAKRVGSVKNLIDILTQVGLGAGLTALFSFAYIVQILSFAPSLAIPALIVIGVQIVLGIAIAVTQVRMQQDIVKSDLEVSGLVPILLNGVLKLKLAGAEKRAFARWAEAESKSLQTKYNIPFWYKISNTLPPLVTLIGTILIYWVAGTTNVSLPEFMAFNVAYGAVLGAVTMLASMAPSFAAARAAVDSLKPLLEAVPEPVQRGKTISNITGSIEMSGLTFRYTPAQKPIIDNLSLKISPGEYLAVVGKSGSGKSTLMRLLLGLEKPERGAIYYSGQDLNDLDIRSLRRIVGVCLQNGSLFSGTIFHNITISSPRATMDDAWEAAELAGVADDIRAMPMGMHTLVSEGSGGVSGGQRQRILIAQAVCSKPRILMFDEATSALDNVTQKHVSDALAGLKCTRIVVAHRLSTIKLADRIVMLDGGHIIEEGTYDELIALDGEFAELVRRQQLEKP